MIRNIGIEEGGRILTDGNRTIKFERVDHGYDGQSPQMICTK